VHQGNVVQDRSEDGLVDEAWDGAHMGEVIYQGQSYLFAPGELVKTIPTAEGTLYIGQNGDYLFKPFAPNGTFSGDDFQYRLVDRDGDWSVAANVRLGGSDEAMRTSVAYDDMAHTGSVSGVSGPVLTGNVLNYAGMGGATDLLSASAAVVVAGIYYNDIWYAMNASSNSLEISTSNGGRLHVNADGSYYYQPANGHSLDGVADHFNYVVREGTGANVRVSQGTTHLFSDDRIVAGSDGGDRIDRSAGFADEAIVTDAGNDLVFAGFGDTVIDGGSGNDILEGGSGNDIMFGGSGSDTIAGGSGNDVISGGAGNDVLSGGEGSDVFSFGAADSGLGSVDVITDFNAAEGDTIELGELLNHLGNNAHYELVQDGENTLINILNGNNEQQQQIVVEGTNAQALQDSNAIYSSSMSPMMRATDVDNELMSNFLDGILGEEGSGAEAQSAPAPAPQENILSSDSGGSVVEDYQQAMQEQMDITKETGV
jgi:Ca2+-binding RTX toxin-like protein